MCLFLLRDSNVLVGGLSIVCIFLAFLVRKPAFMVQLCLHRVLVEAPISGSIIFAGVLLKVGGYIMIIIIIIT